MEGYELRGSYPLTSLWLRATELDDQVTLVRVSIIVARLVRSTPAMTAHQAVLNWRNEYR